MRAETPGRSDIKSDTRHVLDGQDLRYRYVAWGEQTDGDQYLLMLRLGTEIS